MAASNHAGSSSLLRAAAVAALAWSRTCAAHEHHMDNIPEGEAVSPEPLVRPSSYTAHRLLMADDLVIGLDIMDSYSPSDTCLWHHLPNRNGSRGIANPIDPLFALPRLTLFPG